MKKVFLILAGSEYEDVAPSGNGTKWKFYDKDGVPADGAILECVLMNRKRLASTMKKGEEYDMYTVMHRVTKKEYIVFCNKVLEDRLKNIPLNSAVRIKWDGVAPGKKYHLYSVGFDRSFKFNPEEWQPEKDYSEDNSAASSTPTNSGGANTKSTEEFEDAPF